MVGHGKWIVGKGRATRNPLPTTYFLLLKAAGC